MKSILITSTKTHLRNVQLENDQNNLEQSKQNNFMLIEIQNT